MQPVGNFIAEHSDIKLDILIHCQESILSFFFFCYKALEHFHQNNVRQGKRDH